MRCRMSDMFFYRYERNTHCILESLSDIVKYQLFDAADVCNILYGKFVANEADENYE